jgi:hypothetical protein
LDSSVNELYILVKDLSNKVNLKENLSVFNDISINGVLYHSGKFNPDINVSRNEPSNVVSDANSDAKR